MPTNTPLNFDKAAYRIAKERINSLIKDSLLGCVENPEGFIADGVICPDVYEKQRVRILCILAESYGYDGNERMTNIEDQMKEGDDGDILGLTKKTVMTPRKLATLLWLLLCSFENGVKVTWEEFYNFKLFRVNLENKDKLQKTLAKVAWINVKKASRGNGTKLDVAEFRDHAHRNREILRQQIEVIVPNLIIVCGEDAFRALYDMKLPGLEVEVARKWQIQAVNGGPHVIEVSHPSTWWGYEKLYRHFEDIYTQSSNFSSSSRSNFVNG